MSITTDDDGRVPRTGTFLSATAHIITAVIGSGILSLAWATAQLGWVAGPTALLIFSVVTWYTSILLTDSYRTLDPVTGRQMRNYIYMDCVRATLGGRQVKLCGVAQYCSLVGSTMGYVITASSCMDAIRRSNCFHKNGHQVACTSEARVFMIIFGAVQIILCQIPNFHELSFLSIIAAVMSIAYSTIGLGLAIAKVAGGVHVETSLTGTQVGQNLSSMSKTWSSFAALGNIAFAYSFSSVLVEIQDTLKSSPPENIVMKKAASTGVLVSSIFYIVFGMVGYAAFGNRTPGNLLTDFGFYEPFWLVDLANVFVVVHLVGAYQVFCQPFFDFVESRFSRKWPNSGFINEPKVITLPNGSQLRVNYFKLVWRTVYVISTTTVAIIFPFFNSILGLLGAISFWPITVYFPVEMYIVRAGIQKYSKGWILLKLLSLFCFIISVAAAVGATVSTWKDFVTSLGHIGF